MSDVQIEWDEKGFDALMIGKEFIKMTAEAAEAGKTFAIAISPGSTSKRRPGHVPYAESFEVIAGLIEHVTFRAPGKRACADLVNNSNHATSVELGWSKDHRQFGNHAGYHVLEQTRVWIAGEAT